MTSCILFYSFKALEMDTSLVLRDILAPEIFHRNDIEIEGLLWVLF
jgi:hypothetical protein